MARKVLATEDVVVLGKANKPGQDATQALTIQAPKFEVATIRIRGTAPLVMHKFSAKQRAAMVEKQMAGSVAAKGKRREPKDFQQTYEDAMHVAKQGWHGIPAPAFRAAMISACRLVGFKMTLAKLSVFILADGYDRDDGTPLVRITKGQPHVVEHVVRNETGVPDVRWRPMWDEWEAVVRVRYDADQFTATDVVNLMMRVGQQVGLLEGRPDSKDSAGQGWGTFEVLSEAMIVPMKKRRG